MNDYLLGEVRMFAGVTAPQGWALCDGRLLEVSEHQQLFQLVGTAYGGDGQASFALPDMRGRVPMHRGQGPQSKQSYARGERGGAEKVALTPAQLGPHHHTLYASTKDGYSSDPTTSMVAKSELLLYTQDVPGDAMSPVALDPAGNSAPHENRAPYVALTYIIALTGTYPSEA
jgi:microcystin-dependent protein